MLDREDTNGYVVLVRSSPRPTAEQIRSFAWFVSNDHSWYKHLPVIGSGEPFFLYLRPHAHETLVDREDGGKAWRGVSKQKTETVFSKFVIDFQPGDVVTESSATPLAYEARNTTTAEWQSRYGLFEYWNHGDPDQPRDQALAAAKRHLRYLDDTGTQRPVPHDVLDAGLVYLRATVSPHGITNRAKVEERNARGLPPPEEDRAAQLQEMIEAMNRVVSLVFDGPAAVTSHSG